MYKSKSLLMYVCWPMPMLVCAHNIFVITFSKPGVSIFQPFHPFFGHLGVKATKGPVHSPCPCVSACVCSCVPLRVCMCVCVCHTSRPIAQPPQTASITNFNCQRSRERSREGPERTVHHDTAKGMG